MAWQMKAKYYEACNCELGCPCNMSGFPSHGKCEGSVAFQVVSGDREGVDLTGAKVAAAVKWPGAIHEGNGSMALFVDCTEVQRDALLPILTAQDPGLPWEILSATVTDIHGPFFETIEIVDNGSPDGGGSPGPGGLGLIGMRERTALHDGQLSVGPAAGGGFAVKVRLPTPDGTL